MEENNVPVCKISTCEIPYPPEDTLPTISALTETQRAAADRRQAVSDQRIATIQTYTSNVADRRRRKAETEKSELNARAAALDAAAAAAAARHAAALDQRTAVARGHLTASYRPTHRASDELRAELAAAAAAADERRQNMLDCTVTRAKKCYLRSVDPNHANELHEELEVAVREAEERRAAYIAERAELARTRTSRVSALNSTRPVISAAARAEQAASLDDELAKAEERRLLAVTLRAEMARKHAAPRPPPLTPDPIAQLAVLEATASEAAMRRAAKLEERKMLAQAHAGH